jgi:predicted ATPase
MKNIIFFDSPVYIKIRRAIKKQNFQSLPFKKLEEKYLKGYPDYIEELYEFIDKEYIDIPDFNLISQEIQAMITGKLEVSQSGDINYRDASDNIIPLSLTAMGISNVGLIDLLIRNNIINKGSYLIMDEPEVHLHPKWQVFLAQILYKIAKSGATIILATHSLDFLKAFENILKQDGEEAEELISINQMPYDKASEELSELEKVGLVLDDLSKPFYDLYMQDI